MESLWIPEAKAFIRFHDLPGREPAIVLLHGLGSASSADFPAVTHQLGLSDFRFILPDFLGFGFSDRPSSFDYSLQSHAETIRQVLHSLGLSGVRLFGHSMGGTVAIALAAAHPDMVRCLALAEANLDPGVGGGSKIIAAQTETEYVEIGHMRFLKSIGREVAEGRIGGSYAGALRVADPVAMHRSAVGLIRGTEPSQRDLFLSMKMPRAFIFGEHSAADPDVDRLRSQGIEVFIVPKAGHGMMEDNPQGFGLALKQALGL